jgi:hypothetical protein
MKFLAQRVYLLIFTKLKSFTKFEKNQFHKMYSDLSVLFQNTGVMKWLLLAVFL